MKSMGQQFLDIMQPRLNNKSAWKEAVSDVGEKFEEGARERSRRGEALPNAKWNNQYNEDYAQRHGKSPPVNLRLTGASMKGMRTTPKGGNKAAIRGNRKLREHDKGTAPGRKTRQLFPKRFSQVPRNAYNFIRRITFKILKGGQR